jgi:two-component system cell cycle response regulator
VTARVLVVDDVPANVRLLEARLSAEYFDVATATTGREALAICDKAKCDVVLLDVMMPDMDGFEVCRRIKSNPASHHIPVVLVTALDQPADRVKGLQAGADDFLSKPVSDIALIARVRSLARLKLMTDELRMRAQTSRDIGVRNPMDEVAADGGRAGRILIVDDRRPSYERLRAMLAEEHAVDIETGAGEALFRAAEGNYDLLTVSLALEGSRRSSAVQPDPLARTHPQPADPGGVRGR